MNYDTMPTEVLCAMRDLMQTQQGLIDYELKKRSFSQLGWETLARSGRKVDAIFCYHNTQGVSLTEARRFVEAYMEEQCK